MDGIGQIYEDDFMFKEENPSSKRKEYILKKRIIC